MHDRTGPLDLTTSAAADLLGVHPSSVKRWADRGVLPSSKTDGGHRRLQLRDLLATARERGIPTFLDPFSPWESNVWMAVRGAAGSQGFGRVIGLALGWLARGDTDLLGRLFYEVGRQREIPLTRFLDEGVRGFMTAVGEEWQGGRLQVGEEHLATQVVLEALQRLRFDRESTGVPGARALPSRPVAIVGSMEGDYHDLGAQGIRAILETDGWKVYYLGPNVPVEEFSYVQQAQFANLVCISFSPSHTLPDLQRAVKVLGEFYRPRAPYALALGGSLEGVGSDRIGSGPFEALHFSRSASDFLTWLKTYDRTLGSGEPRSVA